MCGSEALPIVLAVLYFLPREPEMFCEHKAAQMAAYLIHKTNGRMPHMKLMKLMYLTDRFCYQRFDRSMSKDSVVSMDYGPVLSKTYDLMKGRTKSDTWSGYISPIENNEISLVAGLDPSGSAGALTLGKLSRADLKVMDEVFSKYGDIDPFVLSELTHEFPEWRDPHGSSLPIPVRDILQAVGKEAETIKQILEEIEEMEELETALAAQ